MTSRFLDDDAAQKSSKKHRRQTLGAESAGALKADDIDKMKQRANENQMFTYVKIPEVALTVSYKVIKHWHFLIPIN